MTRVSSFRERAAWTALSTYVMVFFLFFWMLPESWVGRGNATMSLIALGAFVLIVGAQWLGPNLEAPRRETKPDEREQLIALNADRVGGIVTTLGAAGVTAAALAFGYNGFFLANLILAVLLLGQIAKTVTQIVHFKTGA
jgi:hypothetical protein